MDTADKLTAVDRYIEAFATSNLDIIRELYAEDATVEDPVGSDVHRGIEAICGFYGGVLQAGIKLTLTGTPRCAGNAVAFPFQVQAPGMEIDVIDVFEFNDAGKVVSMRAYWGPENSRQA